MKKVTEIVAELALAAVEEAGCTLWDTEYVREAGQWYLRLYLDKEGGVDILDCEAISRKLSDLLDEADPIEEQYYLEVCSPGLERELKNEDHIYACEGWDVEVRLYAPIDNSKLFRGKLLPLGENGDVVIDCGGTQRQFPRNAVAKIQTYFEF